MKGKKEAREVLDLMKEIEFSLFRYLSGIKRGGREARVKLIKLEKLGLQFRKNSAKL